MPREIDHLVANEYTYLKIGTQKLFVYVNSNWQSRDFVKVLCSSKLIVLIKNSPLFFTTYRYISIIKKNIERDPNSETNELNPGNSLTKLL